VGAGSLSLWINQVGNETYNSLPSSGEDRNSGVMSPLSHVSAWHGAELIKHNFNIVNHVWDNLFHVFIIYLFVVLLMALQVAQTLKLLMVA
jgi:hypothetical protein